MLGNDTIIVGGSIGGLAAANRLADLGDTASVLEGGLIGSNKVCGEFLSPSCLSLLDEWGVQGGYTQKKITYQLPRSRHTFTLPQEARSIARESLELQLAKRARSKGIEIIEECRVEKIDQTGQVFLTTGERFQPKRLIVSTGRLPYPNQKAPKLLYLGLKCRMKSDKLPNHLCIYPFKGGYGGLSRATEMHHTLAVIISRKEGWVREEYDERLSSTLQLPVAELRESDWIETSVPSFGIRSLPNWPNSLFVGDALATIPPATGSGLSLALLSGAAVGKRSVDLRKAISFGKAFHWLLSNRVATRSAMAVLERFPRLFSCFFRKSRCE